MPGKPDVLFVVLDSARRDRISAFGHDRETTPVFDELAAEATGYDNAFVPAPWTLPSHCSMFTGKSPSEHGVTNGFTDGNLRLGDDIPTIAELLSEAGYVTAGFSNNPWVGKLSGLNRGFDRFVEWDLEISRSGPMVDHGPLDETYSRLHTLLGRAAGQPQALLKRRFFTSNLVNRAKRWVDSTADRPSFTFMNLMEAHSPYYPPRAAFRDLGLDPPGVIEPRTLNTRLLAYVLGKADLPPETRERVMEYYDASLRYQDGKLGELLSHLRSMGLFDDTMIVVCADHGKTLGDYDREATPPHYVRDINIHVPLLIKGPNQRQGNHVTAPVELTDLFDAILGGDNPPRLPPREDGALVEDHVPHTGRNAAEIVRWRVLADPGRKYVRNDEGDEFLFERPTDEALVEAAATNELRRYRNRLRNRVADLDAPSTETSGAAADGSDLGGAVEGQLRDLGYLS